MANSLHSSILDCESATLQLYFLPLAHKGENR